MSNRLQHVQSPYLLQHKDNPVAWWPWGDDAFDAARAEDKPIFLSIGYSTCHWCHVMAHESFEDEEVARLMNEAFISIKVDREERPDIDGIYMTVCQMMSGQGGWPLTILMTPDKKPFFAATYIPKQSRHGRLGMLDLVPRIEAAWRERREEVVASAEKVTGLLVEASAVPGSEQALDGDVLHQAYAGLRNRFDPRYGGFGRAPKFPSPHNLLFLLRYWKRTGEAAALHMVEHTLQQMRLGGIYDHLGYGFHRYSTDQRWLLPHFEKMLYDQAMLAWAYTEAFQATRNSLYEQTAREIFTYVLRDMTAPEGGFYSAEDADSEGREGAFYVWTFEELQYVLDDDLVDLVMRVYHVEPGGNFEDEATRQKTGENVLHLTQPLDEVAAAVSMDAALLRERLGTAHQRLVDHRAERERPGLDDKILTDWNGLMIGALAHAARVFDEPAYAEAARHAADFALTTLRTEDGRLLHRYRGGEAGIAGQVDDYAFMVHGLLELYETTFTIDDLRTALALNEQMLVHFWDEAYGGLFFTPDDGEALIARQKEAYDGAIPSGNSVAMLNLMRLARLTGTPELEHHAADLGRFFGDIIRRQPTGFTALLLALDMAVGPSYEVVIAGDPEADGTQAMLHTLRSAYIPNKVVVLRPEEPDPAIAALAPYTAAQQPLDGQATAYVCRHFTCEAPTTDPIEMLALLGEENEREQVGR